MSISSVRRVRVSSSVDKDVEHPQFFDPPYALKCLQAGLEKREGLTVSLLDCWIRPMTVEGMLAHTDRLRPHMVVVSASSFDIDVADRYVQQLRTKKDPPLIVGIGQGFYHHRDREQGLLQNYDAVVMGEPEQELFR